MARLGAAVLVVSFLVYPLCGQEPKCTKRTVPVGVPDAHGNVPHNLNVDTFTAEWHGKPLEITGARLDPGPRRAAILVDTTGSMGESLRSSGKANLAYWVLGDAIKRLPANVSIAVLGFNEQLDRKLDFSVPREQLVSEITEREKSPNKLMRGKTALRDAIKYVLDQIPSAAPGDAIYVITDGVDNHSRTETWQLAARLEAACVRLSVFLLEDFLWTGDPFPGTDETVALARATGGTVIGVKPTIHDSPSGTTENFAVTRQQQQVVSDELTVLYRQTATLYLLDVSVRTKPSKAHKWKLIVADPQQRKSTYLFYPHQIASCEVGRDRNPTGK